MDAQPMTLPPRITGWRSRLYGFTLSIADQPHVYGTHDCALLVAGGIDAMHGTGLVAEWRGRYRSYQGGLRVLRKAGYRDPLDMLARLAQPVAPGQASIGDIAVIDLPDHPAVGFVMGETIHALRTDGLVALPLVAEINGQLVAAAREVWRT